MTIQQMPVIFGTCLEYPTNPPSIDRSMYKQVNFEFIKYLCTYLYNSASMYSD